MRWCAGWKFNEYEGNEGGVVGDKEVGGLPQSCALNVLGNIFNREIDLVDSVVEWSVYGNVRVCVGAT